MFLIVSLMLGVTMFASLVSKNRELAQIDRQMDIDFSELTNILDDTLEQHDTQSVLAISGLFTASEEVSRQEFHDFTSIFIEEFPDTVGLTWSRRVLSTQRADYEKSIRAEGFTDFEIYEKGLDGNPVRAGVRGVYYPVTFIEPLAKNRPLLGFDNGSSVERQRAINSAAASGEAVFSQPVRLMNDGDEDTGILLVMPIYRNGRDTSTLEDRLANLEGVAIGSFSISKLVVASLKDIPGIDMELFLFDVSVSGEPFFITYYDGNKTGAAWVTDKTPVPNELLTGEYRTVNIDIGNRKWMVIGKPGRTYTSEGRTIAPWGILIFGYMLTIIFLRFTYNRQLSMEQLARSEAEFRGLSDYALTGILRFTREGEILYANNAAAEIFGYESTSELFRYNLRDLLPGPAHSGSPLMQLEDGSNAINRELVIKDTRHNERTLLYSASALNGIISTTMVDVTDRLKAAREIRQLSSAVVQAADSVVITDIAGNIEYVNPAFENITGYSFAEIIGKNPRFLNSGIHTKEYYKGMWETVLAGNVFQAEIVNRKKDGSLYQELKTISPVRDESGRIIQLIATGKDITERKAAEEKLVASEHRNRAMVEAIPDLLFRIRREGTFLDYKTTSGTGLYLPPEKFLGRTYQEVMPPEFSDRLTMEIKRAFTDGLPVTFEYELPIGDEPRTFEARVVANQDEQEAVVIVRDVTEDRRLQAAIKSSEEKYRLLSEELEEKVKERTAEVRDLYDRAPTGYHSLDPNGNYRMINQTELDWLGYTREEVIGRHITEFLTPRSIQDFKGIYPIFMERGWVKDLELDFIRKGGSILQALINSTAIKDANGRYLYNRSTVFDNTEKKKAEVALQESRDALGVANIALAKASKLKDEFLASMSHELRTPLTGILGLSEALQMETYGDLNDLQRKALANLEQSGRHLLDLINDILDLSKIEADKLELANELCGVSDICQASIQLTKGMAHQKHMLVNFSTSVPMAVVWADPRRFKQMVVNLLSNSIKFTPDGGQLGIEVTGSEEEQLLKVTVWDKGAGIKQEDMGKLFKPFTQLDTSLTRSQTGTGLGLSLVSRLAEMHGGSISVESKVGEGSRFTICLPWTPEPATLPSHDEPEPVKAFKRAVLIEDIEVHQKQIGDYLNRLGIEYIPYKYGKSAVELVASHKPDLVVLDLGLPDIPGSEVIVALKNDSRTAGIPVVISSVEEDQKQLKELGAAGYLVKPFDINELRKVLEKISQSAVSETGIPATSTGTVTVLVADDNEVVLDTIADFLRMKGFKVVTARDGRSLVNLVPEVRPDVILTDIQMPGVDGLTAIREIRAMKDAGLAGVPIVAITALAMPGDKEMCINAGANHYLSKPLKLDKLAIFIQEIVTVDRQKMTGK